MEIKFAKNKADDISLAGKITILLEGTELKVSNLEMQIAFKETVLKSPKDMEDAKHIRIITGEYLNHSLIQH